ncbi:MAG: hypothetical protein ACRCXX_00115 [Cetobacterium sp.]|uniref:hypothetical protein n=1 Tax=Cetobacterium sp. TaxID=2071632 RepID=UPI003F2E792B
MLIAGSKANTRPYNEHAYLLANEPKEIFFVEGATHISLYDIPEYVNQAVDKMTQFYKENL